MINISISPLIKYKHLTQVQDAHFTLIPLDNYKNNENPLADNANGFSLLLNSTSSRHLASSAVIPAIQLSANVSAACPSVSTDSNKL